MIQKRRPTFRSSNTRKERTLIERLVRLQRRKRSYCGRLADPELFLKKLQMGWSHHSTLSRSWQQG